MSGDELTAEYLDEARGYIDTLNEILLSVEGTPGLIEANPEVVNEIFRAAHSLKGLSACFGFMATNSLTHDMENLFDAIRKGDRKLGRTDLTVLFEALDMLAVLTEEVARSDAESTDPAEIKAKLGERLKADPEKDGDLLAAGAPAAAGGEGGGASNVSARATGDTVRVGMERLDLLMNLTGELLIARSRFQMGTESMRRLPRISDLETRLGSIQAGVAGVAERLRKGQSMENVLDSLRDLEAMTGEVAQSCGELEPLGDLTNDLLDATLSLDGVTEGIQKAVMAARMVDLETVFRRFQRIARDTAASTGKQIRFVIEQSEARLDKRVADEIINPLTHLIRNAIDHGIEKPEQRREAGKPSGGTVTLSGYQSGTDVIIEVKDDGGGMDAGRLIAKAVEKGILTQEEADGLEEQDAYKLIFRPGFSTAEAVTDVSGRGMGMDIVESTISSLRGSISVFSDKGQGTRFFVRLPLSLSILTSLLVRLGDSTFAVPLSSIVEIVLLRPEEVRSVHGRDLLMLRDKAVPLLDLGGVFHIDRKVDGDEHAVIIHTGEVMVGVRVDELIRKDDLVIKPLCEEFSESRGLSGLTILGDGNVALILDPSAMTGLLALPGANGRGYTAPVGAAVAAAEAAIESAETAVDAFVVQDAEDPGDPQAAVDGPQDPVGTTT